uniref:Uncharacterized protein n=1 Tax=Zooxanthella nutricula TaxID=1333877 RepID=A0A7S2IQI0_9DINO|mmetsp:Transcript_2102/g.6243  ORF Transcript_2102/g.6243 Transcript_2102/m.6243 type:complete len:277 (+) Transcript_2102:117-947(+)
MPRPVLVSLAMGLPGVLAGGPAVPVLPGNDSCAEILAAANVTGRFAVAVAHGIHDITVEDLREFKGDVPCAGNGVPTVNRDLRSESAVLPSAPCLDDGDSPFATPAMRVVDAALTRMDDMNYDIGTTSGLQRLVHAFHMREVWALASAQYQALAADPPGRAACACALDVDGNSVLEELRLIASSLRSAQMASSRQSSSQPRYDKAFLSTSCLRPAGRGKGALKGAADLLDLGRMRSAADWAMWKATMAEHMALCDTRDLAVFLYCTLNREAAQPHN